MTSNYDKFLQPTKSSNIDHILYSFSNLVTQLLRKNPSPTSNLTYINISMQKRKAIKPYFEIFILQTRGGVSAGLFTPDM